MEPLLDSGMEVCSWDLGHMIKMAAMPNIVKTIENLLLRNRTVDDLETWYALLGTRVLPIYSNGDLC